MPRLIGPRLPSGKFTKFTKRAAKQAKAAANSKLTAKITRVVKNQAESKHVTFYENYNPGNSPNRNVTGTYVNRGWMVQNKTIGINNTDIKQLIPFVVQGTEDNQRDGRVIRPTSLIVDGSIRVSYQDLAPVPPAETPQQGNLYLEKPTDIKVVIYVLQHVSLKDYDTLYASNNFGQLLSNGENTTVLFNGQNWQAKLPVANQYYRLLKKKIVTLRYAGISNLATPANVSIANSHNYYANYTMNLSKHLPAQLKYPESNVTGTAGNSPTNSSIFMCMGYYDQQEPSNGATFVQGVELEETYVSKMTYKDI